MTVRGPLTPLKATGPVVQSQCSSTALPLFSAPSLSLSYRAQPYSGRRLPASSPSRAPGCMPRDITRGRWCARCAPRGRRSARVLLAVLRRQTRAVNRHQFGGAVGARLRAEQPRGPPSITSERRRAPLCTAGALGGGSAIAACRGVRLLPVVFRSGTSALVVACWKWLCYRHEGSP